MVGQADAGADAMELAAGLRAAIAELERHIHTRAAALAAPQITAAEQAAAATIRELTAAHALERQRWEDTAGELRRQLDVAQWGFPELGWAACHLPRPVRLLTPGVWPHPQPPADLEALRPGWCQRLGRAAAATGGEQATQDPGPTSRQALASPPKRVDADGKCSGP